MLMIKALGVSGLLGTFSYIHLGHIVTATK
jgi:hypothetical protein